MNEIYLLKSVSISFFFHPLVSDAFTFRSQVEKRLVEHAFLHLFDERPLSPLDKFGKEIKRKMMTRRLELKSRAENKTHI